LNLHRLYYTVLMGRIEWLLMRYKIQSDKANEYGGYKHILLHIIPYLAGSQGVRRPTLGPNKGSTQ